jgi:cbb3-type cytochrome oxidase maturation protein
MQIILFLIILSLTVAGGFLAAFFWAVRDGQFDDDVTPSMRLLIDDDMIDHSPSLEVDDAVSTTS